MLFPQPRRKRQYPRDLTSHTATFGSPGGQRPTIDVVVVPRGTSFRSFLISPLQQGSLLPLLLILFYRHGGS
jgi:hypothetical protein